MLYHAAVPMGKASTLLMTRIGLDIISSTTTLLEPGRFYPAVIKLHADALTFTGNIINSHIYFIHRVFWA